jgi:hypothetical protein
MGLMNGIEIGTAMGKREMLLILQKACVAAGGTLSLEQINQYSKVVAIDEMVWAVERYEGEIQGDIRRQSILISEMTMHNWRPTDTESHSMECSKCGEQISMYHMDIWDEMQKTLCSGKPKEVVEDVCPCCDQPGCNSSCTGL